MGISDERKPDREGYLGFKDAIDNGNEALNERATALWRKELIPTSELAHYANVYAEEASISYYAEYSTLRRIAEEAKRLIYLKDPALTERIWKRFERLSKAYGNAMKTEVLKYDELNRDGLKTQIAARQRVNPHETESQSWFNVKQDIVSHHLWCCGHLRRKFETAVDTQIMIAFDKQISRKHGSEAKGRAATALDRARQATATFKRQEHGRAENDNDRER